MTLLPLENILEIIIRRIGSNKGVVLPKPLLVQVGLDDQDTADVTVENGAIVLRKPARKLRTGWAEAAKAVAAQGGDGLWMGEFGNGWDMPRR